MKITSIALVCASLFLGGSPPAVHGATLITDALLTPFAPQAPRKSLQHQVGSLDPASKDAYAQFTKGANWHEKMLAAAISLAIAGLYLFRRFRRR